ncbi:MAG: efflux RND transporter periplasmic adaptor subunit [Desulfobacterales bacterium]
MEKDRADLDLGAAGGKRTGADPRDIDPDRPFWRRFAEASSPKAFCQSWLPLQCRMVEGIRCAMVLMGEPDQGPYAPVAVWPDAKLGMTHLTGTAEKAVRERRGFLVDGASPGTRHIAYPILVSEKIHGVVVLEVEQESRFEAQSAMRQLHWGAAWLEVLIRRTDAARTKESHDRLEKLLDLIVSGVENGRFYTAAMSFVTKLSILLKCDRVSLGFIKKNRIQVSVLSHSADFSKQMNLMRAIGLAMDEAVDQKAIVKLPADNAETGVVTRTNEELARKHGSETILTIPLQAEGRCYGGLLLERPAKNPFGQAEVELCDTAAGIVGAILNAKRMEERWIGSKAIDAAAVQLKRFLGPGYPLRKLIAAGLMVLVLFFSLYSTDYRITATGMIEGRIKRAVAAPFDGYVKEASVRAGDTVGEGDLICLLDDRDLKLERFKWLTERNQLENQFNEAMANHERSRIQITKAKMEQAEAQIALIDEQLSRTQLRAPFDAVVMSGDLTQSLGAPVERGDVLFELAPLDAYRVIIEVDERDISKIAVGQKSELIFSSIPGKSFPFTISKITPVTTAEEGRNFFRVEGRIETASARLRPGMEGIGKITVDRRKLIWIWTHRAADWLRLQIWRWIP